MQLSVIQNKIFEIRGQKVMLDFDLAVLYEVETKALNQAVKRNINRFPNDFMFQLTKEEWGYLSLQFALNETQDSMRSQFVTASQKKRNVSSLAYAFTEHGVTMLASVLRSERAVQVNIAIVRAFIALREMAMHYKELEKKKGLLEDKFDMQFMDIYTALGTLIGDKEKAKNWEEREPIGFKGDKKG